MDRLEVDVSVREGLSARSRLGAEVDAFVHACV